MYLPRHYASHDPRALDALIAADPFITLITVRDGAPTVNHLPVLFAREGDRVVLRGHWAKVNPQATHAGEALAIVHGPHAYVSPSWYPDKIPQSRVPTWNYVVAHLHGTLELLEDTESLAAIVSDLSDHNEPQVGQGWRYVDDDAHRSQLRGIVGFRMVVDRFDVKAKLSQNHPMHNREAVIARLAAQASDNARDVARLMRDTLVQDD
ncbi:FMN-binding negative transcriptional regulator [Lysobacter sp. KIS68-7]|uniref:FMN-binding negative transcriptional regulator n=1 Tax=Lysobacter sp. KIS68-7 TaxID=2904252 RepID=UPI001E466C82|nr:FMN-binding negative transcriptional regulator [Lysobacter sp. KIS68-7]UHQ19058.1 FMN-binding negative transcriptional regulator [Lysobacter sp. KIS68-7]